MTKQDKGGSVAKGLSRRELLAAGAGAAAVLSLGGILKAQAADGLVALVHTQAAGDNGPIDGMIAALKKLSEEEGFQIRTIYAQDPATFETILRGLGTAGAKIVITTFLQMGAPVKAVAPDFPDTKFIELYADPLDPPLPNVRTVSYNYHLGCYLSGLFGAKFTTTKSIGYIGGVSIPGLNADLNAMKLAAASVSPDIKVTGAFAGSFQDPAKGREIAAQMYQDGVDYIQTDGAATDIGVIQAATEGEKRFVSGGSKDQIKLGPKQVVSLVLADFGQSLYSQVKLALADGWKGSHYATGLNEGVIDFILSDEFLAQADPAVAAKAKEVFAEVSKVKDDIAAGKLEVPFNPNL